MFVTTEKQPMGSPVSRIGAKGVKKFQPNAYNEDYNKFTELLTLEEWAFLRDDYHAYDEDYFFLVHKDCPEGLNIRPEGAVMHFETLKCQQCKQSPPDGMMAVYALYAWHNEEQFGAFDDGTIE